MVKGDKKMKMIKVEEIDSHKEQYINTDRIAFIEPVDNDNVKEDLTRIYFDYNFFITVYGTVDSILKQLKSKEK